SFLKQLPLDYQATTYRWDNMDFNAKMVIAQWAQAKRNLEAKVPDFVEKVLHRYEAEGIDYVLVGYSLGSRMVAEGLKANDQPLEHLRGIYFLGSALPAEYDFSELKLSEGMKIKSYYSDKFDTVLKVSFFHAEGVRAGGEVRFPHPLVLNYRTACHHVNMGGPIQRDYSELAEALGWLILKEERVFVDEEKKRHFARPSAGSGKLHWNEITRIAGGVVIEQNANSKLYRAVKTNTAGKREEAGRSMNLHTLLSELGAYQRDDADVTVYWGKRKNKLF
ncbi:MAG: hypothetical protein AAF226_19000, partial [Verrucomicrobiota bacterium]